MEVFPFAFISVGFSSDFKCTGSSVIFPSVGEIVHVNVKKILASIKRDKFSDTTILQLANLVSTAIGNGHRCYHKCVHCSTFYLFLMLNYTLIKIWCSYSCNFFNKMHIASKLKLQAALHFKLFAVLKLQHYTYMF